MFQQSAETDKLDAAIAKVQAKMLPVEKGSENPFFKSSYADLTACYEAVRSLMAAEGITFTQWVGLGSDSTVHLTTRVALGGQYMLSEASIPVAKKDPQGHGSAITYLRRYALCAALGIVVVDEDDDANEASKPTPPKQKKDDGIIDIRTRNEAERKVLEPILTAIKLCKHPEEVKDVMDDNAAFIDSLPDNGKGVKALARERWRYLTELAKDAERGE